MERWNLLLTGTLPEAIEPEAIEVPGYFLKWLGTPQGILLCRILVLVVFCGILFGFWYYEKKAKKEQDIGEER